MKEQVTLCARCASDYRQAGYGLEPDYTVKAREPCEKCNRMGWTYLTERAIWQKHGPKDSMHPKRGSDADKKY